MTCDNDGVSDHDGGDTAADHGEGSCAQDGGHTQEHAGQCCHPGPAIFGHQGGRGGAQVPLIADRPHPVCQQQGARSSRSVQKLYTNIKQEENFFAACFEGIKEEETQVL